MSSAAQATPPSLSHTLGLLIGARYRMLIRAVGTGKPGSGRTGRPTWIRYIVLLAVIIFLAVVVTARLVDVVGGPAGRVLLAALLTFTSSVISVTLFLFAIPAVMAALTYKSDLKLLLLTPLSPRLLLAEKFIGAYVRLSIFLWLIGIPILLGIGRALDLGPGYSLVTILVLLLLPVAPLGLALLVLVGVLRWLPPRWARTTTAVLGTVFGLIAYIGTQLLTNGGGARQTANLRGLFAKAPSAWWQSLPTTWPGRAMEAAAQGQAGTAVSYLAGSGAIAFGFAVIAVLLAAHLFSTGWATYQETGTRRTRSVSAGPAPAIPLPTATPRSAGPAAVSGQMSIAPEPRRIWRSLWRKDWRDMRRDPQLLARLGYPLVIVAFGLYRAVSNGASGAANSSGARMISLFITLAIYVLLLSNFLAPRLINREGRAIHLLALAPVGSRQVLGAKWSLGALPIVGLVEVFVITGSLLLHLAFWTVLLCAGAFGCLAIAMVGALLALSLVWPRLDWDNPTRQVSIQAALYGTVGGLGLCGGTCALLATAIGWSSSQPAVALLAGIGIFVLTLGIGVASLIVGDRAMANLLGAPRS